MENKMGVDNCIKCGWVINRPLNDEELKNLLSTTNQFISSKISNNHAKNVIKQVKNRLAWQKELANVHVDETPICRYCLFEIVRLYMKDEEHLFEEEFIKNYDFNNSIIS
ncbi:MAG: hypothetical protein GON13_02475 [Nanoarchaeota archaeon]|nr:hypothetical protein [Nanoarchaeota archaeon]